MKNNPTILAQDEAEGLEEAEQDAELTDSIHGAAGGMLESEE